jgi:hypothetical protein
LSCLFDRSCGRNCFLLIAIKKQWACYSSASDLPSSSLRPFFYQFYLSRLSTGKLDVCGSVHHSTILTVKNPTKCNSVSKFYYFLFYMKLNMFRATHRPSSGD